MLKGLLSSPFEPGGEAKGKKIPGAGAAAAAGKGLPQFAVSIPGLKLAVMRGAVGSEDSAAACRRQEYGVMVFLGKLLTDKPVLTLCSPTSWFHLSPDIEVFI